MVMWLLRIPGLPSYALTPHHVAVSLTATPVPTASPLMSFGIFIECVVCLQSTLEMELPISAGDKWGATSPAAGGTPAECSTALACPSMGWDLAKTGLRAPSGLSVGDWVLDLVIQGTELSWGVLQPFQGECQKPQVCGRKD